MISISKTDNFLKNWLGLLHLRDIWHIIEKKKKLLNKN